MPFHTMNPHAVAAFVAYPVNGGVAPAPGQVYRSSGTPPMPDTLFRNRFLDGDDMVVQAFANSLMTPDWRSENAGAVRIHGLGQIWFGGSDSHSQKRSMDSLVDVDSEVPLNLRATGRVTWYDEEHEDGGGAVTMNLNGNLLVWET